MLSAFNRGRRFRLGCTGTASLEFALVAIPFLLMLIAGTDLGRYFLTQHSLRTATSTAARSMLISCYPLGPSCTSVAEQFVPFLGTISPTVTVDAANRKIDISSQYSFTFILPAWAGLNPLKVTDTTSLHY
jgi:hypothetical protein